MANSVISIHFVRFRKLKVLFGFLILTAVISCVFFVCISNSGLESNTPLQKQITQLRERLAHAQMASRSRLRDLASLRQGFEHVLHPSVHLGRGALWRQESETTGSDLRLPSLQNYLPHLGSSFEPAFKIAGARTGVNVVLGIPTVRRPIKNYLLSTLDNLIHNLDDGEKEDALLVVCIAEIDAEYIEEQIQEIRNHFQRYLDSGLLEVIVPPKTFYPDFENLTNTLGDPIERVKWRTKQNLDYAYLMMYAQAKGTFYVQLEDDILTKANYLTTMRNFAAKKLRENKDWIILDFCQLGFIGKMFKAVELSKVVTFFAIFHSDKPVDWLLDHMIHTKVCRFDRDSKDCRKQRDSVWIHYRPSLFQHVGIHSSLKGKLQRLKDKQYGKDVNPPADVRTSLPSSEDHTLVRVYSGESYFYSSIPPRPKDNFTFDFKSPALIERYFIRSGYPDHTEAILTSASVLVRPVVRPQFPVLYPTTEDNFLVVGQFSKSGVAEGTVIPTVGSVGTLVIMVDAPLEHKIAISQILIEVASAQKPEYNTNKLLFRSPTS